MNRLLGVMQGRFVNRGGFFPQNFPWRNWKEEFEIAQKHEIGCIELEQMLLDYDKENIVSVSGVTVNSICANYFMQYNIRERYNSLDIISRLAEAAEILEIQQIIIPLFGSSEIINIDLIYELFDNICDKLGGSTVRIGFETNLSAITQKTICRMLAGRVGICYDVGNAAGCGYDSAGDILEISEYLLEIHLKDKRPGGTSVMLGNGTVDFSEVFRNTKTWDKNIYILESLRLGRFKKY